MFTTASSTSGATIPGPGKGACSLVWMLSPDHAVQFLTSAALPPEVNFTSLLDMQGEGLKLLLAEGAEKGSWPEDFAAKHQFTTDPVISVPDVSQVDFEEQDEILIIATDGLWDCMPPQDVIRFARWVERVVETSEQCGQPLMWPHVDLPVFAVPFQRCNTLIHLCAVFNCSASWGLP